MNHSFWYYLFESERKIEDKRKRSIFAENYITALKGPASDPDRVWLRIWEEKVWVWSPKAKNIWVILFLFCNPFCAFICYCNNVYAYWLAMDIDYKIDFKSQWWKPKKSILCNNKNSMFIKEHLFKRYIIMRRGIKS